MKREVIGKTEREKQEQLENIVILTHTHKEIKKKKTLMLP